MQNLSAVTNDKDVATKEFVEHYGTCSTSAGTQNKTVNIPSLSQLSAGTVIRVNFLNAQSYNGSPTLDVNSLGAKYIRRRTSENAARYEWMAGEIITFIYDGTYWVIADGGISTTTYYGLTKLLTSVTSSSEVLSATPQSINHLAQYMISGAPVYSSSSTYEIGDRVRRGNYIYECKTQISTAEAWNSEHWDELPSLQTQIDGIEGLPAVTASDNGKVLTVVNGAWAAATLPTYQGGVS